MPRTIDYKSPQAIRASAVLTNSYVAGTTLSGAQVFSQLVLLVDFTIGSLTSAELKVEFSHDNSTFYQETFSSISAGTDTDTAGEHKFSATGKFCIPIAITAPYIKVSAKGTGTVTNSLMAIEAVFGVN